MNRTEYSPLRLGVDLGGTKIEAGMFDETMRTLVRIRVPTPRGDYQGTIRAIADLVERAQAQAGYAGSIGVGTPGSVSPGTGLIRNANSTVLIGKPLARDLQEALHRPIRMTNDANCLALSEAFDGAAAGAQNVFAAILGTGVGGGLAVFGRIVEGANAVAGEWGHNTLPFPLPGEVPGPRCYCGKHGCIETFLSGPALSSDYEREGGERIAPTAIAEIAETGDPRARAVLDRYEDRLARGLASIVNLLDPDVIVLGGGVSNVRELYAALPQLLKRYVFSDTLRTRIVPAAHGDSSGVRGAAMLWND